MISLQKLCALCIFLVSATALAQDTPKPAAPAPDPIKSVLPKTPALIPLTVNSDDTVTFRYRDKSAQNVAINIEGQPHNFPMTMDDTGLWSVTSPALPAEIYGYNFVVDGNRLVDTHNIDVRRNFLGNSSNFLIPATPAAPWELTDIPHGRIDQHIFTTKIEKRYTADQVPYDVYLPPNYDAKRKGGYPVLYLLHGYSDPEYAWINVGRANLMLDSMIAEGKAVPMIVVLPLGYGNLNFVTHGESGWNSPTTVDENTSLFSQSLLTEIMPTVEHEYNTAKGRQNRAITGLSMGGLESLTIGLNHPDLFAYVGGFSAGGFHADKFDEAFPGLDPAKANLKLLWIACGSSDGLLKTNTALIAWLKTKDFDVTPIQTPGAHNWIVWRDNLLHFAPLLFQPK